MPITVHRYLARNVIRYIFLSLSSQVYGTEMAVTLAISFFEQLAAVCKRGDAIGLPSKILTSFVAANEENLGLGLTQALCLVPFSIW